MWHNIALQSQGTRRNTKGITMSDQAAMLHLNRTVPWMQPVQKEACPGNPNQQLSEQGEKSDEHHPAIAADASAREVH
jgi:hypothetical protein